MRNSFYIYKVGENQYVKAKALKLFIVDKIDLCSYWIDKRNAKSWERAITHKYKNAKLIEAKLIEK